MGHCPLVVVIMHFPLFSYYYNCKTEVSQWEKPREWVEQERARHSSAASPSDSRGVVSASRSLSIKVCRLHSNASSPSDSRGVVSVRIGSSTNKLMAKDNKYLYH